MSFFKLISNPNFFFSVVVFLVLGAVIVFFTLFAQNWFLGVQTFTLKLLGQEVEAQVLAGERLLSCLGKLNVRVPSPCGGRGTCHQCKVQVKTGGGDPSFIERSVFSKQELKEGWRLACQVKIGDHVLVDSKDLAPSSTTFLGRVISNKNVGCFIKELIVEVKESLQYVAGQYLQVHIPSSFATNTKDWQLSISPEFYSEWEKYGMFGVDIVHDAEEFMRAYSFASYPQEWPLIRFTVRIATPPFSGCVVDPLIEWGLGSSYLFSRVEGDEIIFSGPFGASLMVADNRPVYLLIGGAGASFGRSHVMSLLKEQDTSRVVELWYGARSLQESIYRSEFLALEKNHPNFQYHLVLSQPGEEEALAQWPMNDPTQTGFLFSAFEKGRLQGLNHPERALYYICGPPLHNDAVVRLLRDYAVSHDAIHLDAFGN